MVPLREIPVQWDKKNRRKMVILSPPLIPETFRCQKISDTRNVSAKRIFGAVRQKKSTESGDPPSPQQSYP